MNHLTQPPHAGDAERRLDRRQLFRLGGLTVTTAALVAACGGTESPGIGRVGVAPTTTDLPDGSVDDVVLLRTAASIQHTMIDLYGELRSAAPSSASALIDLLIADHTADAEALNSAVAELGGEPFECGNPRLEELTVPVIAAVNGFALGGGCELMLACDFAVAADNARIGVPEVTLGVIPGFGGTVRLANRVGVARARQLMFTGLPVKADEAARMGLVNEAVPKIELMGHVHYIADKIAKNAPKAVAFAKRATRVAEQSHPRVAGTFEQELFAMTFATADQKEGMTAFLEKRPAAWKGH